MSSEKSYTGSLRNHPFLKGAESIRRCHGRRRGAKNCCVILSPREIARGTVEIPNYGIVYMQSLDREIDRIYRNGTRPEFVCDVCREEFY